MTTQIPRSLEHFSGFDHFPKPAARYERELGVAKLVHGDVVATLDEALAETAAGFYAALHSQFLSGLYSALFPSPAEQTKFPGAELEKHRPVPLYSLRSSTPNRAVEITDHYKHKSDIPGISMMTPSPAPFHKIRRHTRKFARRTARGLTFRSASGRHGADPDFIILGIQKGGTNAARYNLNRHPQINIVQDEVHYFDKKYYLPLWWYKNHFVRFEANIINGEATPVYMRKRCAIDRIHKHYPDIKLIAMIREPIQRAFSKWNRVKLINDLSKSPTKPFLSSMIGDDQHLLTNGFYYDHIEYIMGKFSRENIHIAISEQVLAEPAEQYNRMVRFLDLPAHDFKGLRRRHQTVYSVDLNHEDIKELYDIYRPYNEKLYDLLGGRIKQWEDFYGRYDLV